MISMTGYSYNEEQNEDVSFSLEVKSYNNRYLDIFINVPSFLNPLEPFFRDYIGKKVSRGRVELNMRYHELTDSMELFLDETAVDEYISVLNRLKEKTGIDEPLTIAHLQQMDGLIKSEKKIDLDAVKLAITPLLEKSCAEFIDSRKVEGANTYQDILNKLDRISTAVSSISTYADEIEERVKGTLLCRFQEVMGDEVDLQRVYTETAVLLVKYSINEELERLDSHITAFRKMASSNEPVGKKLDFLAQEMNREINTIGSKNVINEVSQSVVESKDALEQIREQLRNVE